MTNSIFPKMFTIQQEFESHALANPQQELRRQLIANKTLEAIKPGMQVAIAMGSRGITDIVALAATLVDELRQRGAEPFIVPAIGSQGGATPEGQAAVLRGLGITEEKVGAPIRSFRKVVKLGETSCGLPVYCDELAYRSDLLVLINRVKPHTAFKGDIESGLMKMMAVGLGKKESAQAVHSSSKEPAEAILESARLLMQSAPVGFGIAVVEDAYKNTSKIAVLGPGEIEGAEKDLLRAARQMMPQLPFDELDVLIVEKMGKNISGAGMDPNIIGMGRRLAEYQGLKPNIDRIVVLDLTEQSQGNAEGIGLADVITQRLVNKVDFEKTYINCVTSGFFRGGMVPITIDTDREAIALALTGYAADRVRLVRIRNTLKLDELDVSLGLLDEVRTKRNLRIVGERGQLAFNRVGDLI